VEYTAAMEKELDEIEDGKDTFLNTLNQFWKKFEKDLKTASKAMRSVKGVEEKTDEVCDKCGFGMVKKFGRYGSFLACSNYPDCKTTRQLAGEAEGAPEASEEALSQPCPEHTEMLVPRKGRFGFFLACPKYPDCKVTKKLVRGAEGRLELEKLRPIENEFCPDCKKPLAWRKGRFGNFIACSDYPSCKYIKKKEAKDIGLLCPQCNEGQIVERKGRFGKPFYGCRRYPQCKFTAYHRPIAEPCPKCAKPYLLQKDTKKQGWIIGCSDDDCGYERPMDGPPQWAIEAAAAAAIAAAAKEAAEANAAEDAK